MLPIKRGMLCVSRASSSRRVWNASNLTIRRFYAEDSKSNGSEKNVSGQPLKKDNAIFTILALEINTNPFKDNAKKEFVDDIIAPQRTAPDEPPRYDNTRTTSSFVRPAPPAGTYQLPERKVQEKNDGLAEEFKSIDAKDAGILPEKDEAAKKAERAFQRDRTQDAQGSVLTQVVYRLYVSARSKNCIMTLVDEDYKMVGRTSSGLLGFRNVAEGSYEAGYQCAKYMIERLGDVIAKRKELVKVHIYLKGFGQGRSALLKALTMSEGDKIRNRVEWLTDRTPIKVGGVRLQKARRL